MPITDSTTLPPTTFGRTTGVPVSTTATPVTMCADCTTVAVRSDCTSDTGCSGCTTTTRARTRLGPERTTSARSTLITDTGSGWGYGDPMKLQMVRIDQDGTVHCPVCNSTAFIFRKSKQHGAFFNVGTTSRTHCVGCGAAVKPYEPTKAEKKQAKKSRR